MDRYLTQANWDGFRESLIRHGKYLEEKERQAILRLMDIQIHTLMELPDGHSDA